ncbi:MAG: chemotaxis-specific protein-glutamate methyltransferase CheB [bacterium]|nr:chemotaxis-specific protein-glutamate methyltransferase CheB [bacterium]
MKKLSVLVVDDSAIYRKIVGRGIEALPGVELVGYAEDGLDAIQKVQQLRPDLLLLDIEMPRMDGLQTIRELKRKRSKTGVIVVSSVDVRACSKTLSAIQQGAFELVAKPGVCADGSARDILARDIGKAIEAFRFSKKPRVQAPLPTPSSKPKGPTRAAPVGATGLPNMNVQESYEILVIGISTGGPAALSKVIPKLAAKFPIPIVIVQHMPAGFTKHLAETLNGTSNVTVVEGEQGMTAKAGQVVIAPGGYHLSLSGSRVSPQIKLDEGPMVNGARPAVDRLFESTAKMFGPRALCAVMTGMGTDGMEGARAIRNAGGYCITQDQASCIVYGMPKAVADAGLANEVVTLLEMEKRMQMLAMRKSR